MHTSTVLLPHGLYVDGSWLRTAQVRELNGHDEQMLYEMTNESSFQRLVSVLARIVAFGDEPLAASGDILSRLTIGDLTALILTMRKMRFGENLHCFITCPACLIELSIDLSVSQLLQAPRQEPRETYEKTICNLKLKLRPATYADLEHLNKPNLSMAENLVRSCIISSQPLLPAEINRELVEVISSMLSELDPQADLIMNLACPDCKHLFEIPFFPEDFLLQEIDSREPQFEKEIHWLAFNYHWSEYDILSLTVSKRKRYIELINRTLSGESV